LVCLVERGEPCVEKAAGGAVGDKAHLVAEAGQADEDEGVNGADMIAPAGRYGSIGGIAEDDGVDLGWIILVVGSGCGAGRTVSPGGVWGEVNTSGVAKAVEDREERADGSYGGEQDGSGA
jgi:hypothetical protein